MIKVLLSHPDIEYSIGDNNPKTGSIWECIGFVEEISGMNSNYDIDEESSDIHNIIEGNINLDPFSVTIHVKWANGTNNTYKPGELTIVGNEFFTVSSEFSKCKSIW